MTTSIPTTSILTAGIGIFACMAMFLQRKKDDMDWRAHAHARGLDEATDAYDECYEAWTLATKRARRIDGQQLARLRQLERVVATAEDAMRVSEGLGKALDLARERDVPTPVRGAILLHWIDEAARVFGGPWRTFDTVSRAQALDFVAAEIDRLAPYCGR